MKKILLRLIVLVLLPCLIIVNPITAAGSLPSSFANQKHLFSKIVATFQTMALAEPLFAVRSTSSDAPRPRFYQWISQFVKKRTALGAFDLRDFDREQFSDRQQARYLHRFVLRLLRAAQPRESAKRLYQSKRRLSRGEMSLKQMLYEFRLQNPEVHVESYLTPDGQTLQATFILVDELNSEQGAGVWQQDLELLEAPLCLIAPLRLKEGQPAQKCVVMLRSAWKSQDEESLSYVVVHEVLEVNNGSHAETIHLQGGEENHNRILQKVVQNIYQPLPREKWESDIQLLYDQKDDPALAHIAATDADPWRARQAFSVLVTTLDSQLAHFPMNEKRSQAIFERLDDLLRERPAIFSRYTRDLAHRYVGGKGLYYELVDAAAYFYASHILNLDYWTGRGALKRICDLLMVPTRRSFRFSHANAETPTTLTFALVDLAQRRADLRRLAIIYLEDILLTPDLDGENYSAALEALHQIYHRRIADQMRHRTIRAKETLLQYEGLYPDVYSKAMPQALRYSSFYLEGTFLLAHLSTLSQEINHTWIHYRVFFSTFIERVCEGLDVAYRYSLSLSVYRLVGRTGRRWRSGDSRPAVDFLLSQDDALGSREMFSKRIAVLNILHEEQVPQKEAIEKFERDAGVEELETIFGSDPVKIEGEITDFMRRHSGWSVTILYEGHGARTMVGLTQSKVLTSQNLADAISVHPDLNQVTLLIDACQASNFAAAVLDDLSKKGSRFPMIVNPSDNERYGFGHQIRESLNGILREGAPILLRDIFRALPKVFEKHRFTIFAPVQNIPARFKPVSAETPLQGRTLRLPNGVIELSGLPVCQLKDRTKGIVLWKLFAFLPLSFLLYFTTFTSEVILNKVQDSSVTSSHHWASPLHSNA